MIMPHISAYIVSNFAFDFVIVYTLDDVVTAGSLPIYALGTLLLLLLPLSLMSISIAALQLLVFY